MVSANVRHHKNAHHGESHGACISFLQLDAIEVTTARGSKMSNAKGRFDNVVSNLSSCRPFREIPAYEIRQRDTPRRKLPFDRFSLSISVHHHYVKVATCFSYSL